MAGRLMGVDPLRALALSSDDWLILTEVTAEAERQHYADHDNIVKAVLSSGGHKNLKVMLHEFKSRTQDDPVQQLSQDERDALVQDLLAGGALGRTLAQSEEGDGHAEDLPRAEIRVSR